MPGIVWNPPAVAELLRGPTGPVVRHLMVVGELVKQRTIAGLKPGVPREFLAPTIVKRITQSATGPAVQVGTDKIKTLAHQIKGNPLLVFYWPKAGATVFTTGVNHPGSDFTQYLTERLETALKEVGSLG